MGGTIAKYAFQPPDPAYTRRVLCKHRQLSYAKNLVTGEETSLVSFFKDGHPSTERLTILYSHGNAEDLGHSFVTFQTLSECLDVDFVAYDYPGYGLSPGEPTEVGAYGAGLAVFDLMTKTLGIPRSNIVLVGRSLGSGPTTHIASLKRGCAGLVLISPLATAASVAGSTISTLLYPADIFCNRRKIGKVKDYPVLIFHGTADEVVPFSHGKELFDIVSKTNPDVTFSALRDIGHNDIGSTGGPQFFGDFQTFLTQIRARAAKVPKLSLVEYDQLDNNGRESTSGSSLFSCCISK